MVQPEKAIKTLVIIFQAYKSDSGPVRHNIAFPECQMLTREAMRKSETRSRSVHRRPVSHAENIELSSPGAAEAEHVSRRTTKTLERAALNL